MQRTNYNAVRFDADRRAATTAAERGPKTRIQKLARWAAGLLLIAGAADVANAIYQDSTTNTPAAIEATAPKEVPVASLVGSPGASEKNGLVEVEVKAGGTVSDALQKIALAEGHDPNSLGVQIAINKEANVIQKAVDKESYGEVVSGDTFAVDPASKLIDPNALKAAEPKETIRPIG